MKVLTILALTFLSCYAKAVPTGSCLPGDISCPIAQNLKWDCGFIHHLSIESDATGDLKGHLGLGSIYGGNSIRADLSCAPIAHSAICKVETSDAMFCDSAGCKFGPWVKPGSTIVSVDIARHQAVVTGIDAFQSQLNPAPNQWPLTMVCKDRDQVVKEKVRTHICKSTSKSQNEYLKVVTFFSLGLQNFYIIGAQGAKNISCQGQMFSAGKGSSDFALGHSTSCPFDFAIISSHETIVELSCDRPACKSTSLECTPQ